MKNKIVFKYIPYHLVPPSYHDHVKHLNWSFFSPVVFQTRIQARNKIFLDIVNWNQMQWIKSSSKYVVYFNFYFCSPVSVKLVQLSFRSSTTIFLLYYSLLVCTILLCSAAVLYCTMLNCTYCCVKYFTVLRTAYRTVLYCTVLYCTVLYCTALYCIALNIL